VSTDKIAPAPWRWQWQRGRIALIGGDGKDVIVVAEDSESPLLDISEAHARLIAAAPDLLAALEGMDALVESLWKSVPWGDTFDLDVQALNEAPTRAKRAIAKATGESQ